MEKLLKSRPSVITAIVHELLKVERFESHADLAEAVKVRCARLKILYDSALVGDAIDLVARTRPVLHTRSGGAGVSRHAVYAAERTPERFVVTRDEAAALMARIRRQLQEMR